MQYLALEAVRLKLGPLRASVRLGARLGVCQVDFMISSDHLPIFRCPRLDRVFRPSDGELFRISSQPKTKLPGAFALQCTFAASAVTAPGAATTRPRCICRWLP